MNVGYCDPPNILSTNCVVEVVSDENCFLGTRTFEVQTTFWTCIKI